MTTTPDRTHEGGGLAGLDPVQEQLDAIEATRDPGDGSSVPPPAGPGDRPPVDEAPGGPPPPRGTSRWVRWVVAPLLVVVPLVYVLISADQSRDGGAEKEQEAAARHLTHDTPSMLLRRIYQVPLPYGVTDTVYMETNAWDHSELYCRFTTSAGGLDTFLALVGTNRSDLADGRLAIGPGQAAPAGWTFPAGHAWAGVSLHQVGDRPDHDITVDLDNPDAPVVYVVSTVNFQHGFGGG